MSDTPPKLSDSLRAWRDRNGWKQWRAAQVLRVPLGTYQRWERGRSAPRGLALEAVLKTIQTPC